MGNVIFRTTDSFGVPVIAQQEHMHGAQRTSSPSNGASLSALPTELKLKIATHLGGRDRLNFALACKAHHSALAVELLSGALTRDAGRVRDLHAFETVLGRRSAEGTAEGTIAPNGILDLPLGFRSDPLLALFRNIPALPVAEQAAAVSMWRGAALPVASRCPALQHELAEHGRSTRMANRVHEVNTLHAFRAFLASSAEGGSAEGGSASGSIGELRPDLRIKPLVALASRIDRLAAPERSEATLAFLLAVRGVDARYRDGLEKLERAASAEQLAEGDLASLALVHAIKSGEAAHEVIRRAGISNPMEMRALTHLEWGVAVKMGEPSGPAALRYGILGADQLEEAIRLVATFAIKFGEPLQSVLATYGISEAGRIEELTEVARAEARDALRHGHASLPQVIARYGITRPEHVADLLSVALDEARQAILAGNSLDDVVTRFGLTDAQHVAALSRVRDEADDQWEAELMGMAVSLCRVM